MNSFLGNSLVLISLFFAAAGAVLGFWAGAKRNMVAWSYARTAAIGFAVSIIAANLVMIYALLTHDFSVKYVAEVGSLATPAYITVISLWASLNGSILFWGGILGVYVLAFLLLNGHRHREYMPYTIGMLLSTSLFFVLLISSVANPFEVVPNPPLDGPGPNPLLQNHWLMGVHPPTLYLGYVGMVVPYAMICAALFAGRLDNGWMIPLRRWMLIPWAFLTVGILLGGWWSYGVLGWGGYWAWDPVENASLHPWLTGTAFIHSAMVYQRRGTLRIWTLVLGISTFLLTLVGTFMTRSGVFNSVHSFTQSAIGPIFLVFIAICLVFSILLLAVREPALAEQDEISAGSSLMTTVFGKQMHPLGREFSILLQNVVFATFTFVVLLGTLFPLITEALEDRKVSVGEPYFDKWALPLGVMLVFLMGVGPALPWGKVAPRLAAKRFLVPTAVGLVLMGVLGASGFTGGWILFTGFLCGFAFAANAGEFITPVRVLMTRRKDSLADATRKVYTRTRRRLGGHIAHYGVIIAALSIALSKGYKQEIDVTLNPGETAQLGRFEATYAGTQFTDETYRKVMSVNVDVRDKGAEQGTFSPRMNYYPSQREPIFTPAIYSTLTGDFYLSVVELPPQGEYVVLRMISMPGVVWLWIAPLFIVFGTGLALWPARKPARRALPSGSEQVA